MGTQIKIDPTQYFLPSEEELQAKLPFCGGIENAVKVALKDSGKMIPWRVATISTDGRLLD